MGREYYVWACMFFAAFQAGCLASGNGFNPGQVLGRDHVVGEPGPIPAGYEPGPNVPVSQSPAIGDSCRTGDINHICLALKYVVFEDSYGVPVVDPQGVIGNLRSINQVWSQCNLGFQVEQYLAVRPADYQMRYQVADHAELEDIRDKFQDSSTLLVATTGTWDRSGTLGSTAANAWTSMPANGPFGAILERPVATYPNIIGHELGHYLNLPHVNDALDLMSPVIYANSTKLTASECANARAAAGYFWARMYR